jgi:hypothetical protein
MGKIARDPVAFNESPRGVVPSKEYPTARAA